MYLFISFFKQNSHPTNKWKIKIHNHNDFIQPKGHITFAACFGGLIMGQDSSINSSSIPNMNSYFSH